MKTLRYFLIIGFVLGLNMTLRSQCADNKIDAIQEFDYNSTPEQVGISAERLARIDSFFTKYVHDGNIPNVVTFVTRHGVVIHNKAFGWRNVEKKIPVTTTDIFRIASQSKAIVSVALMTLYEEGRFQLDDPISNYIPEFKNIQVLDSISKTDGKYYTHAAKRPITIRHLLTHTAGLPYQWPVYEKEKIPYFNSKDPITTGDVVKKLASLPIKHEPGAEFTYGMNIDVIGYLIEILSGEPLDKFLKERVLDPLGMTDTYFYLPKDKADRLVSLYSRESLTSPLTLSKNETYQTYPVSGARTYFSGGAGLCGTIEDYAKFCQMLLNKGSLNGKQILGRKTVELMTMNQIGNLQVNGNNKFGLGFEITTPESAAKQPCSIGGYRWGGMYSTDYYIDPKEDLIMLIYTNAQPFAHIGFDSIFKTLVYQALK